MAKSDPTLPKAALQAQRTAEVTDQVWPGVLSAVDNTCGDLITPDMGSGPLELNLSPRRDDRGRVGEMVQSGRPLGALRQAYADLGCSHDALKTMQGQLEHNEKLASLGRLMALGRPGHVQQVVMNLVQNAVDAVEGQADPTVTLHRSIDADRAVLAANHAGPDIPEAMAQAIFAPFFTTKPVGLGAGLWPVDQPRDSRGGWRASRRGPGGGVWQRVGSAGNLVHHACPRNEFHEYKASALSQMGCMMEHLGCVGLQAVGDCNIRPWHGEGSCAHRPERPVKPHHLATDPAKAAPMSEPRLVVGPLNLVEGDLEVSLDVADGVERAAFVNAPPYRGFERLREGKAPSDALTITPRICDKCSTSQSAALARMAALIHEVENLADHPAHFHLFFMPDLARPLDAGPPWHGAVVDGHPVARNLATKGGGLARVAARLLEPARTQVLLEGLAQTTTPEAQFMPQGPSPRSNGSGEGQVEAARGSLGHWLRIEGDRIASYQIIAPTTSNFSPRAAAGVPGPLEAALVGVQVAGQATPLSVQHIVRSFDPCMVCTVH